MRRVESVSGNIDSDRDDSEREANAIAEKVKYFAVLAILCGMIGAYALAGDYKYQPHKAVIPRYDLHVPFPCLVRILQRTNGRNQYDMQIGDFLRLKSEVEACGGTVEVRK